MENCGKAEHAQGHVHLNRNKFEGTHNGLQTDRAGIVAVAIIAQPCLQHSGVARDVHAASVGESRALEREMCALCAEVPGSRPDALAGRWPGHLPCEQQSTPSALSLYPAN